MDGRDGNVSARRRGTGGWVGIGASGESLTREALSSCRSMSGAHLASQHAAASPILSETAP